MRINIVIFILLLLGIVAACKKNDAGMEARIYGTWVMTGDGPGKSPADTITFYKENNQNLLKFFSGNGSPGPGWPSEVVTEFKWQQDKLYYKDYLDPRTEFIEITSLEWTDNTHFNLKFHELLQYISADYRVYYEKVQ